MVQLTIQPDIDKSKIDVLLQLLKSWNVEGEISATFYTTEKRTQPKSTEKHELFSKTFGMWKNRDINIKQIRQQARERRTHTNKTHNDTL